LLIVDHALRKYVIDGSFHPPIPGEKKIVGRECSWGGSRVDKWRILAFT